MCQREPNRIQPSPRVTALPSNSTSSYRLRKISLSKRLAERPDGGRDCTADGPSERARAIDSSAQGPQL